jgi:chromosome segregation ATPase
MKNIVRIACFALLCLSVALLPRLATAQPQGIGQGQSSGVQSATPGQAQDRAAQIQALTAAIKDLQHAIDDAMKEFQQLIDDLKKLRAAFPAPPKDSSSQEKDAYTKRKTEWQYRLTAKEHQIVAVQAKINQLQKQLSDLKQQLSNLQKASGDSSGRALPPVQVIPER